MGAQKGKEAFRSLNHAQAIQTRMDKIVFDIVKLLIVCRYMPKAVIYFVLISRDWDLSEHVTLVSTIFGWTSRLRR